MIRGLFMMPTRGMRMMHSLLVIARLMVFGGFLVMTRGVPILFGRFLVLLRSLGRHGLSSPSVARVPRAMRDTCACIHQRTLAQASHAICGILATNVEIMRKTCRLRGQMHHTCSALHRPRAADRRRAQAQPAFKGYSLQVILVG